MREILRLGLDSRNTSLVQGTGVAYYTNMLGQIGPDIGFLPEWLVAGATMGRLQRLCCAMLWHRNLKSDFSSPDIFRVAQGHFDLYHRPLRVLSQKPPQLMHWTYPMPLYLEGTRNIITIHDLIPLQKPSLTTIDGKRMRRLLNRLIRLVDGIVTVSETTKTAIIETLKVPSDRVTNLYQGVDVTPFRSRDDNTLLNTICPVGSLVVIGSVEPRKNIARLIAAHALSQVSEPLVIIGPDGPGAETELAGAGDRVIRVPYASRENVLSAMARARAVLFPSLAEGFGLPIVEAFALSVPVMTSRGGATEEISGGAAVLVDPYDIYSMATGINLLCNDNAICEKLRTAGYARAKIFSTSAYAFRVQEYYRTILSQPPRNAVLV